MPSKVLSARRAGTAACHHRCVTTTINNAASSRSRSSSLDPSLLQTLAPSSLPCYALFSPNTALAGACRLPPLALNMDNIDTIDDRRAHRTTLLAPEPRPCVPRADYRRRHAGARRRGAPERQPAVMWERSDERRTQHHRPRACFRMMRVAHQISPSLCPGSSRSELARCTSAGGWCVRLDIHCLPENSSGVH